MRRPVIDLFKGKVIAITGAASGVGFATAELLASRGAIISLADLNAKGLESATNTLCGGSVKHMFTVVDVRETKSVDSWIESTLRRFDRLDGAVNMAGVIKPATPITKLSDADWDFTMDINMKGVFTCLRAELNAISPGGSIVSAASTLGQMGAFGNAAYGASKAAVINLTQTAAKENPHIRVNCVSPGSVKTPLSRGEITEDVKRALQDTIQKRRAEPCEIAKVIAFLLSDDASYVTGSVHNVDGGSIC